MRNLQKRQDGGRTIRHYDRDEAAETGVGEEEMEEWQDISHNHEHVDAAGTHVTGGRSRRRGGWRSLWDALSGVLR